MILVALLAVGVVHAAPTRDDAAARLEYEAGKDAFESGDYTTALACFERAHSLSGRPALLFNQALAAERIGDGRRAVAALEAYAQVLSGAERDAVLVRIEQLEASMGAAVVEAPLPDPAPPTEPAAPGPPAPVAAASPASQGDPPPPALIAAGTVYASTMSEVYLAFRRVQAALLAYVEEPADFRRVQVFLVPLAQHVDFEVIGRGELAVIDTDAVLAFTVDALREGRHLDTISLDLVRAYEAGLLSSSDGAGPADLRVQVGGYAVTEFEYHQEPDGAFVPLLELNQIRVYLSSVLNPGVDANRFSSLLEWVPVSEEVIHQVDSAQLRDGTSLAPIEPDGEGLVPFEQAYLRVDRLAGLDVALAFGQLRNPFGYWSDFSSHRNFTNTKNNLLVHGFALKKVELGAMASGRLGPLGADLAVVHGRLGRTSPLFRADADDAKDLSGRVGLDLGVIHASVSGYFVGFDPEDNALGVAAALTLPEVSIVGEVVTQHNPDPGELYGAGVGELSSLAGYTEIDARLSSRWRVYGLYDAWQLRDGSEPVGPLVAAVFHGVRFIPQQQVRWTVLEYGRLFHEGFDAGETHLSTQLEMTF